VFTKYLSFHPHHALAWAGDASVWCPSVCPSSWCHVVNLYCAQCQRENPAESDGLWSCKLEYLECYDSIN